jgi:hypothetical protein
MSVTTTDGEVRARAQLDGVVNSLAKSQQEVERLRVEKSPSIELIFQNESGCGYGDPFVAVMVNGVQWDKVWAYVGLEQGADGGWYRVVKFRRGEPER